MKTLSAACLLALVACGGGSSDGGTGGPPTGSTGSGTPTTVHCASDADCGTTGQTCFYPGEPTCSVEFSCLPDYPLPRTPAEHAGYRSSPEGADGPGVARLSRFEVRSRAARRLAPRLLWFKLDKPSHQLPPGPRCEQTGDWTWR